MLIIMKKVNSIEKKINQLNNSIHKIGMMDDESFNNVVSLWHQLNNNLKSAIFDKNNKDALTDFEMGWGAQSIQFSIDCIPEIHRIMKKFYKRSDTLSFLDVGAGSGAGTNIFSQLHSGRHIYSKLIVDAVDYISSREKWVKLNYPRINYSVNDIFKLEDKKWDLVYCSHVIEHVEQPKTFLSKLVDLCKGFLFVYSPYNETDKIPAHINTITKSFYNDFNVENFTIIKSMAWHADIDEDKCLLAVINCGR